MRIDAEIRDLGEDRWPRLVWHYCPPEAFYGIVTSRTIRLSAADWMNDPSELHWGRRIITRALQVEFSKRHIEETLVPFESFGKRWPHIACFSSCKDSVAQWRAYAADGTGYALGIDPRACEIVRSFPQRLFVKTAEGDVQRVLADWGVFWLPMVYDLRGQRTQARNAVTRLLRGDWKGQSEAKLQLDAFSMAMAFKSPAYEYEKEYRIAYGHMSRSEAFKGSSSLGPNSSYSKGHAEISYAPLALTAVASGRGPLRSVRLGPKCSATIEDTIVLLGANELNGVMVQRSRAPYR